MPKRVFIIKIGDCQNDEVPYDEHAVRDAICEMVGVVGEGCSGLNFPVEVMEI